MLRIIDICASTNAELPRDAAHGDAVMALTQTAGRGQRGNSWEAEPGCNVTMSVMLRPQGLAAARQFEVSEAVCLAVADVVEELGVKDVKVKWPNDVYVADRKIAGILIENAVGQGGMLSRSIAGIGLNVNQREFKSDAPNPVSLRQLTGCEYSISTLAERIICLILWRLERNNHQEYCQRLWRGHGLWNWVTPQGETFLAEIQGVLPDGRICLANRQFAFKEVRPAGFSN